MSRGAGPVRQLGLVVRDPDAAMRYWSDVLGIGPFFVNRHIRFEEFVYRGAPSPSPDVTLCFAQSGDLQIEIIAQHDDAPSAYRDFLAAGHEGVQHVAAWFDEDDTYRAACLDLETRGLRLVHSGKAAGLDVRFAYYEGPGGGTPLLELAQATKPEVMAFAEMVAAAGARWDGRDPIRTMAGVPE